MSLQDIKKNAEFVRQLELKGIAEATLTGEPYQGTAKNMSSDEKMYLLAISKECTVPECIEAMKEKFNKIYAYNTIYYWLTKSGVRIIKTPENDHRPPATRVYYSKSLVKDMLTMWNEGHNSNVIAEELTRKYNEPITPCAIQHKIARLRKNSDHTIRVKRNTKPTKVKAQKATPKVEAKPVSPVVQTTPVQITPVIQEAVQLGFPIKKKNVFLRIFDAIFNS